MLKIKKLTHKDNVYDIEVANNANFYANGILIHNCEITQPTTPIEHIDDPNGEIGVCTLSAVNLLEIKAEEFGDVCDIIVRLLDALIDYQDYPVKAAENFCKNRRSLGVGFTNLAGYLAKNKLLYSDPGAVTEVDRLSELLQYSLLNASCKLAEEKGPCPKFDRTKYADGVLPIDTYNKNVDEICQRPLACDWEALRGRIKLFGLRHSTVTAQMPCESSSVVQNSTNGIEPVRGYITQKVSKMGALIQIVPGFAKYKNFYTNAFTPGLNKHLTNIASVIAKYFDMAISLNHYYDNNNYPNLEVPRSDLVKEQLYLYKMGVKTLYYTNTLEDDTEKDGGCASGACSI